MGSRAKPGAGFDRLEPDKFPFIVPVLSVIVYVGLEPELIGRTLPFTMKVLSPEKSYLKPELTLNVEAVETQNNHAVARTSTMLFTYSAMPIASPGPYEFQLWHEDTMVGKSELVMRQKGSNA